MTNHLEHHNRDPNVLFADACRLYSEKAYAECESACRQVLSAAPNRLDALVLLGDTHAARAAFDDAAEAYRKAQVLVPGHALPFSRLECLRWRQRYGSATQPRQSPPGAGRIQMTSLGANGRFGNQLLQYAFLALYACRHGLIVEVPDWIGRYLYGFDDPVPRENLPSLDDQHTDLFAAMHGPSDAAPRDVNLQGYFCGDTGRWGNVAKEFRELFEHVPAVRAHLETAVGRLRQRGSSLVGIHARRGDFGYGRFWIAPSAWYLAWLADLWPRLARPVLYIATDEPAVADEFREFDPVLSPDLKTEPDLPDFVLDHFILSRVNFLAISNSSFSFSAAMMNATAQEFQRPDPNLRRLVPFDPWHAPVLLDPKAPANAVSPGERFLIRKAISARQIVVHIGSHCSGWTNVVRSERRDVTVHELDPGVSLDEFRSQYKIPHINHLRLESDSELSNLIDGAQKTLHCARIDMFHLDGSISTQQDAMARLQTFGYRLFKISNNGSIDPVTGAGISPTPRLAIHERLLPLFNRTGAHALDLVALCAMHNIPVDRVVHVGAHEGKELPTYDAICAKSVVFIEANPTVFERLVTNMKNRNDVVTIRRAIADRNCTVTLHVASVDQSSSILPMNVHRAIYPQIVPAGTVEVQATPLDEVLGEFGVPPESVSLLCIDVQGVEHLVLRGAQRILKHVQGVRVEVNFAEIYHSGAMIEDIESLLGAAGFRRVALVSGYHPTSGDAFYVRDSLVTSNPQVAITT